MSGRPAVGPAEAEELARDLYGLAGEVRELPSDRDRNFHIRGAGGGWVLKVANRGEAVDHLELQRQAATCLVQGLAASASTLRTPIPVPSIAGRDLEWVELATGNHAVRVVTFVEGIPWARVRPHRPPLVEQLGTALAHVDHALAQLAAEPAQAPFAWDLLCAEYVLGAGVEQLTAERQDIVRMALNRYRTRADALAQLPRQWIHNDPNDHNVLVRVTEADDGVGTLAVAGLIDLGDMRHSLRVGELAIALAYVLLSQTQSLAAVEALVRGYCQTSRSIGARELDDAELDALWDLAITRLAVSVCMAARQGQREPDQPYLTVSEGPAWRVLPALLAVPSNLARAAARAGAGREPCPQSVAVRAVLARSKAAAVLAGWDLTTFTPLDAAVESMAADVRPTARFGYYGEARQVYGDALARGGEWRTVHLGVDLFAPEGTAVCAPLAGVVEAVTDNGAPLDYGPTVILRHDANQLGERNEDNKAAPFWTLYGHLGRAVLAGLLPGDEVAAGQPLARLGGPHENGGWAPHLHFQVITDLLGWRGDFPGVAAPDSEHLWRSFSPDPSPLLGIDAAHPAGSVGTDAEAELLRRRRQHLSPSLSLAYREPLHIVRGAGAYLIDRRGRRFLDLVNNVCHVGHCHPDVVRAGQVQMAQLNTNTRYLHDNVLACAERLLAHLPPPLEVVFFTNSGSEANDLALRLARAHTGRRGVVCLDGAYHGNLQSLVDISPHKHSGPGGAGPGPDVAVAPMPDVYRGRHRGEDTGPLYAREVAAALGRGAQAPAAFIHEGVLGCGGQIPLPPGYLAAAYGAARAAGAVCIDDEVQVGFGRVGSAFWAFEEHNVVPDIVTVGKPMGNGHPVAAVVTTRAIAASFHNGMEYFNTFGGNPVSCAIADAVLRVIEADGLQRRALELGRVLSDGLRELQGRFALIGDVRGPGLFVGIELVRDRDTLEPAAAAADYVVQRMREEGHLLSTDGPLHNVIKFKPPLVIAQVDIERMLVALASVLGETALAR